MPRTKKTPAPVAETVAETVAPVAPVAAETPAPVAETPVAETPATEKPDNAEIRRAAIRAASAAFRAFASNASIPVKAIAAFGKAYAPAFGNAPACKPSMRQAAAITVAAIAAGVKLPVAPDAPAVTFPRRFTLADDAGREYAAAIENGCNDNAGKAALLCTYSETAETYTVTHKQAVAIAALIGAAELRKAGAIA